MVGRGIDVRYCACRAIISCGQGNAGLCTRASLQEEHIPAQVCVRVSWGSLQRLMLSFSHRMTSFRHPLSTSMLKRKDGLRIAALDPIHIADAVCCSSISSL